MRNAAVKAGAKFIVSPGFDPEIVNYCLEKEIPIEISPVLRDLITVIFCY